MDLSTQPGMYEPYYAAIADAFNHAIWYVITATAVMAAIQVTILEIKKRNN